MDKRFFITGTDTNVGKTYISSCLLRGLKQLSNEPWSYYKPVQTGPSREDADFVRKFSGNNATHQWVHFDLPASPDQAAEAEGKELDFSLLVQKTDELIGNALIEGAGGLLVPLNSKGATWKDFLEATSLNQLVLVARSSLGTLNHTLLSLNLLSSMDRLPKLVVLSGEEHPANIKSLRKQFPEIDFFSFLTIEESHSELEIDARCLELANAFLSAFESNSKKEEIPAIAPEQLKKMATNHVWFPFTQHKGLSEPICIERAKGIYFYDEKGKEYVDGFSSWWVNNIGHGRPEISEILSRQQNKLDHVMFTGAIHENAVALASELAELCPEVPRTFFSDNGSTSVEVAIKMALQYWQLQEMPEKNQVMHIKGAYHGDTFGAMAVSVTGDFHKDFASFLMPSPSISPGTSHKSRFNEGGESGLKQALDEMQATLGNLKDSLAAIIVEPMLQGAGGMVIQQKAWLDRLHQLAKQFNILLIYDEVFTGIGRVGEVFAYKREGHTPDLVCSSKGITGGTLPLGVTLASEKIFEGFLSDKKNKAFLHGHSYMGNPISTAVARTVLKIASKENLFKRAFELEKQFRNWLNEHQTKGMIKNARVYGGVMAFEMRDAEGEGYFAKEPTKVLAKCKEDGLFLRPLGGTLYFAPPLSITDEQSMDCLSILTNSLKG